MKRFSLLLAALAIACSRPEAPAPTDTREPVGVAYVSSAQLKVYARPDESAEVVATYQHSESVPVLVRRTDWVEIRVGDGSGWVKAADLGSSEEAQKQVDNPTARFQLAPAPVTNLTAKGDVYIEADVNTDGDVVATRIISNDTGLPALADQNAAALRKAKFFPMVKSGERIPFKYYHRVTY